MKEVKLSFFKWIASRGSHLKIPRRRSNFYLDLYFFRCGRRRASCYLSLSEGSSYVFLAFFLIDIFDNKWWQVEKESMLGEFISLDLLCGTIAN